MSEVLQRWLVNRLGVYLDMDPSVFGVHLKDGTLLAQLLHNYGLINSSQLTTIVPSDDPEKCLNNLKVLKVPFELAGLESNDAILQDVADGKGNAAIRLVYQLFLGLEGQCRNYFLAKVDETHIRGRNILRYQVEPVADTALKKDTTSEHELENILEDKYNFIQWYEDKYLGFIEKLKASRNKYNEKVKAELVPEFEENAPTEEQVPKKEEVNIIDPLEEDVDSNGDTEPTYEILVESGKLAEEYRHCNFVDKEQADMYLNYLNRRRKNELSHQAFKLRMQRVLLAELWEKIIKAQERTFDDFIGNKLIKQSQYEKQIATKLLNIRHEKKIIAQNRHMIEKLLNEKREEEFNNILIRKREEHEKNQAAVNFENERVMELHKRLYEERMTLKQELQYGICRDVMDALVDFAVKFSEYKVVNEGVVPTIIVDEWKAIFFKSQPIFEIVKQEEDLLREEVGPIADMELERQAVINEHNLKEYLELQGPWDTATLCPELPPPEETLVVLGYVVHRLLELKYPYPAATIPADLPKYDVAAVLLGVSEPKIIDALKELIAKRAIHLVTVESVINDCLENYKKEMSLVANIDEKLVLATKLSMEGIKSKKGDKKKNVKAEKVVEPQLDTNINREESQETCELNKQTQTPRNILEGDDESITLSRKAELGKDAFETLSLGEKIKDATLVSMIIEYLKDQPDIKGWVVLDYPETYDQVTYFEEQLSGLKVPSNTKKHESLEFNETNEYREVNKDDFLIDAYSDMRESKLVPNPKSKPVLQEFKTYLTAYINARKIDTETVIKDDTDFEFCDENTSPLDLLYANEGVNYSFYYKEFDLLTVKKLARIIIGDMELPLKSSVELFGEVVEELESKFTPESKKSKGSGSKKKMVSKAKVASETDKKSSSITNIAEIPMLPVEEPVAKEDENGNKKEKKGKKGTTTSDKKKKGGKESVKGKKDTTENDLEKDKAIQETKLEEKYFEVKEKVSTIVPEELKVEPPKPGENGWEYANQSLPEGMQIGLATLWENVEKVYLNDFKEVFFIQRVQRSTIIPYVNFLTDMMRDFISRPDEKQEVVMAFQKKYNDIDEELRQDVEIKSELHCQVSELQHELWNMCDERKRASEDKRLLIIADDWLSAEMCALANMFVEAAQLEMDRCVDTAQMLHDYYLSLLGQVPSEGRLEASQLPRMSLTQGNDEPVHSDVSELRFKKIKGDASIPSLTTAMKEMIASMLSNVDTDKNTSTPFHTFVTDSVRKASSQVLGIQRSFRDLIAKEVGLLNAKTGLKTKKPKGKGKEVKGKGKEKNPTIVAGTDDLSEAQLQAILESSRRLFQEWEAAVAGETSRAHYRLQVLHARGMSLLSELQNRLQDLFYRLHEEIGERYRREVDSVNLLGTTICNAIEEEVPMQQELVLQGDTFFVRKNVLLFPDPPPPTPPPLEERIISNEFRIKQLGTLKQKLDRMSPSGVMPEQAFVFLLEDIVVCAAKGADDRMVPQVWSELTQPDVKKVVGIIFGGMEYIDWREFLIYGLDLPYPTTNEILEMRKAFRKHDPENNECVTFEDFCQVPFWFLKNLPETPQQKLRMCMAKQFLFTLFQVGEDATNYTALLIAFCKDVNPIVGFTKALSVATGKIVMEDEVISPLEMEVPQSIVEDLITAMETNETADLIMDDLVENTIQTVEGLTIVEVFSGPVRALSQPSTPETKATTPDKPRLSKIKSQPNLRRLKELPFDVAFALLTACLPWHANIPPLIMGEVSSLGEALETAYMEMDAVDKCVSPTAFLQHPVIVDILQMSSKFKICSLNEVIRSVVSLRETVPIKTPVDGLI